MLRASCTALAATAATLALALVVGCAPADPDTATAANDVADAPRKPLSFEQRHVVDSARYWWALTHGDLDGDGLEDIVFIDGNADASGYLGYKRARLGDGIWADVVIARTPPDGGGFAAGDLETGDLDGDGDVDVLAVKHPGEWTDAAATATVYWYENPGASASSGAAWTPHRIGEAKGAVKDMSIGDFDGDGRGDLAVMSFDEHNVRVHRHNPDGTFTQVAEFTETGIHEGMDIGDLDGDGDLDVSANGYVFANPGGDLLGDWAVSTIDERWYNQTVHKDTWSLNATKTFVTDLDGDGANEVFISHSENAGFPLLYYTRQADGTWEPTTVLDSLPAAHTLMVYDMDLDGDKDIVTGVNSGRAVNLERGFDLARPADFPVLVLLNEGDDRTFTKRVVQTGGIYNGRVTDFDGDGDYDIFRYPNHESRDLYVLVNGVR